MQDTNIFTKKIVGTKRQLEWPELNQLKKDILWVFDENGSELHNAFIPEYSFTLPYWEYVTLTGDQYFHDEQKHFYREGAMIIILCMIVEYIDIQAGNQLVFGDNKVESILDYIKQFEPVDEKQGPLKAIVLLGISIVASITKEDIARNDIFEHPQLDNFYAQLPWVTKTFVQTYYIAELNLNYP